MRDNIYIRDEYWDTWIELKKQGLIPDMIHDMLKKAKRKSKEQ